MNVDIEHAEILYLGDLQRIPRPQPGEVFVLTCPQNLSAEQVQRIQQYWKSAMGDTKLLVLANRLSLAVTNAEEGA
jgi:hypothetical protein